MKKLLLSLLMMAGMTAFAQKDMQVIMYSPEQNATIYKGTPFNLTAQFKNNGTVEIPTTDTILCQFKLNGNTMNINGATIFRLSLKDAIKQDSSVFFNIPLQFNDLTAESAAQLCAEAILFSDGAQVTETSTTNNKGCSDVSLKFKTGLAELAAANSVKVYPNPVSDVLNFNIDYNKAASIAITDITGRLIETTSFEMNNARVDVRNYNKGIYFYQITNSNGEAIKGGKFTVN